MSKLFNQLVDLYRLVNVGPENTGELILEDEETLQLAAHLLNEREPEDTGLMLLEVDPKEFAVGDRILVSVNQPRRAYGVLADDIDELLAAGQLNEPENYYVLHPGFAKGDAEVPDNITWYRHVLALLGLLKRKRPATTPRITG